MVKEKRILSYTVGYLLLGLIICFVGISGVFASTYYMNYNYQQQYYDNRGSSVSQITTSWNDSFNSYVSGNITTVSNSYGAGLSITSPIPLLGGHTYSMSVYFEDINNIALSSKNEISVASSLSAAANDYANNIPGTEMLYSKVSNNTILQFVFKVDNNHTHLFFPWTTNSTTTQSYVLTQVVMEDLGSSGITENEINQSLNSQTNEINNSIQNSTNTITGAITDTEDNINSNIDDMEQSIVDSNKETQEVIKDQFNSCKQSINLLNIPNSTRVSNGITTTINNNRIKINGTLTSNFAPLTYDFNFNISAGTYVFSINKELPISIDMYIDGKKATTLYSNTTSSVFSVNSNTSITGFAFSGVNGTTYNFEDIIFQVEEGSTPSKVIPYGEESCSNKLDEQNDKLEGIQGALTDSSAPNTSGLENSAGWLPAGPLDSILNLPLTMLNSLTNSLGKTCTPLNLKLPYVNKNIQIPCLSAIFAQITGVNGLWTWVGTIASVLILYNYLLNLYAWVDRVLTLRAEFDEAMGADLANWGRL